MYVDENTQPSYGQIIKRIRREKGLTHRALAEITGVSHSNISKIEREHSTKGKEKLKVPIDTLKQICDCVQYPFDKFLAEAGYITQVQATPLTQLQRVCGLLTPEQEKSVMRLALGHVQGYISEEEVNKLLSNLN